MRMLSVNTWLIILNVAVFALNNFVFQAVQWPVQQRREYFPGVTQEAVRLAKPDRTKLRSGEDGTLNYPLIVSQQDQAGRIWQTEVGQERFRAMRVIEAFGHFSLGKFWSGGEVWRLISFQFLHANLSHLVFNMLGLWFVGGLVEQYLGRRRYAVFYLTCGVFGALAYLLLNLAGYLATYAGVGQFPFLLVEDPYTPLIGASAGVFGVMLAAAFIAPEAMVEVMLFIPMRLQTAVYIFLALAVANLWRGGDNAGGDAAHVGGALAGAYLIRRPHLLRDIVTGFGLFRRGSKSEAGKGGAGATLRGSQAVEQILAKISEHGLESLTVAERDVLHRAAGRPTEPQPPRPL